jgi:spore maturation protein CgeB
MRDLLLLDGISGVSLGREISEAFEQIGVNVSYADLRKFRSRKFYLLKSAIAKVFNKRENTDSFYHLPKLDEANVESLIKNEMPENVLIVGFFYKFLSPDFVLRIKKKYGIKFFLYDTDSCNLYSRRREFIFYIENELSVYDEIFSFSKVTTEFLQETLKFKATFLPFGANEITKPLGIKESIDVLFVGSCDLRRIFLLEKIRDSVLVFGDRWTRNLPLISSELKLRVTDKPVWGQELESLLFSSKIVLNITRSHFYGVETGINLRVFEALAAGCFLLTDYCEELAELFIVGEEIEFFRSASELVEKVNFYLDNPEKRREIARKGHEKFMQLHTWKSKAEYLIKKFSI